MADIFSIEYLYEMVLKDFLSISQKAQDNNKKNVIENENSKEKGDKSVDKNGQRSIDKLLNDCLLFIFDLPIISTIHKIIFESLKNYLNYIKEYIDSKQNNKDFPTIKAEEHDIYRAYGFLWGIKFILNPTELQNIFVFNYKYF